MTHVWRITADTTTYGADDLTGKGAQVSGGRWNEKGTPALYAASSIGLACLETLVHLGSASLPLNRYLVRIDIPDDIWAKRTTWRNPPVGWDAIPPGAVSIQAGQSWLGSNEACVLEVPSVIIPEEFNVVINPAHPDSRRLNASKIRKWIYDGRFA